MLTLDRPAPALEKETEELFRALGLQLPATLSKRQVNRLELRASRIEAIIEQIKQILAEPF